MQKERETVGWPQVVQSERGEDVAGGARRGGSSQTLVRTELRDSAGGNLWVLVTRTSSPIGQPGHCAGRFCTCPRESPRLLGPEQRLGREVARRGRAVDTRGGQAEPRTRSEVLGVAEEAFVVLKPE